MESYAAGETTPPLIEETIGENFVRIARQRADREALVEVATRTSRSRSSTRHREDRRARGAG